MGIIVYPFGYIDKNRTILRLILSDLRALAHRVRYVHWVAPVRIFRIIHQN